MSSRVTAVRPAWAIEGGRITIEGTGFPLDRPHIPAVQIGGLPARVVQASPSRLGVIVPSGLDGGPVPIKIDGLSGHHRWDCRDDRRYGLDRDDRDADAAR